MMIIRMYGLLLTIVLQGLVFTTSSVYAAGVETKNTTVKPQKSQRKPKKITHPCARKSATQLNKRAKPFLNSMTIHSIRYEVDRDLIQSVITVESCYKLKALSPKKAQGLMQLIPATAERFGIRNPYNAYQNIKGGTRYLAWLSKRFDGDLSKVLAAYNAGEGKVDRYKGIPPYRETRNYVHDVLAVYNKLKAHNKQATRSQVTQSNGQATPGKPAVQSSVGTQPLISKPVRNLTPQQRQQQAKRQRQRQIQLRKQQQRQAQLRHQQLLEKRRQQQAKQSNSVIVTGAPSRPIYAPAPTVRQNPAQRQPQITIGQPPIPASVAQKAAAQRQIRQATARKAPVVAPQKQGANKAPNGRVRGTYRSPVSKPGRGGWEATKALAPQLFKQ